MELNRELLFFFSGLGVLNGILLSAYFLFFAKPKHVSNSFLGIMLLALSVRAGKSVFYHFNEDLHQLFIQIGITACFFVGPFLYFYICTVCIHDQKKQIKWKLHLFFLIPLILITTILYPYRLHETLWQHSLMNGVYLVWMFYLLLSGVVVTKQIMNIIEAKGRLKPIQVWILNVFIGNLIIWIGFYTGFYTSYIVGALTFSFITYLLILVSVFSRKNYPILYKNAYKELSQKEIEFSKTILHRIETLLITEELFKDPKLKSSMIAERLEVPVHKLSQIINENLDKNFSNYINEYRIELAKKMIASNDRYTLEAIGQECGFNSKSSFYAAFRKVTGTTPFKYV